MSSNEQIIGAQRSAAPALSAPSATRLALQMLEGVQGGALIIELPGGQQVRVGQGGVVSHLRVRDHAVFGAVLARGDIGLAEAWMDELWECDDLAATLGLLASNRAVLQRAIYGNPLRLLAARMWHLLRANTRSGSRRNIEAHYDLGNSFYSLWLDETMTYSAAVFESQDERLAEAQHRKYRRILDRLGARPGQTILEIGCGWGGFAEIAAHEYGCHVHGLTLSPAQQEYAEQRAQWSGFLDRACFELRDYRDIKGQYDHVVSIEMIEAVGEGYWPLFFARVADLLKPGGRCVIQSITIADELFARYRRGTDFIQRYIFPGGMLPSPAQIQRHAAAAGLIDGGDFAFGRDYARTLRQWHAAFNAHEPEVREQGYSMRFIRMWRFYLAYCEAGFMAGDIDVHQYEFVRA